MASITVVHPRVLMSDDIEKIMRTRQRAYKEVTELCSGEKKFRMSIPVMPDDSDEILIDALDGMERLYKEVQRIRGEIKVMLSQEYDMPDEYRSKLMAIIFAGEEKQQPTT